jgi:hypothetical protein
LIVLAEIQTAGASEFVVLVTTTKTLMRTQSDEEIALAAKR